MLVEELVNLIIEVPLFEAAAKKSGGSVPVWVALVPQYVPVGSACMATAMPFLRAGGSIYGLILPR